METVYRMIDGELKATTSRELGMIEIRCGTCFYFDGDMTDEGLQFCDEKETYVTKDCCCPKYKRGGAR